jgi:hypothetical protein
MKNRFLIILIVFLSFSFSIEKFKTKKCAEEEGKVLFIYYNVDTDVKVLKDYKNEKKRFKYLSVNPFWGPEYDSYYKTLNVDGIFKLKDSSRIVFFAQDKLMDIYLPFQYSEITIDTLINDSIVSLTLNNKKFISVPGKMVIDSLVTIVKEGKRRVRYTKIFYVENYGLIYKKNIFDYEERTKRAINDSTETTPLF